MEFLPGRLKLFHRANVVEAVETRKLQQNIQASYESTAGRCFWIYFHPAPRASINRTPSLVP